MAFLELPHTAGCLVCGAQNPAGLKLALEVEAETGVVRTDWEAGPQSIGFSGIVHGGVVATVLDEAMVWAATWAGKKFCLCGELTTRFRKSAVVGRPMVVEAKVDFRAPRLIQTSAVLRDVADGGLLATASGKYVPLSAEQNAAMLETLVDAPSTSTTARALRAGPI